MAKEEYKIKLVKKSGPGELMGEVEKGAVNGEVSFEGLQFDQPGDYVITAVPDTNEFEPIDFNITVKPGEEKPQDPKKEEEPKKDGNRPVIAQIDKTPIKLKPLEVEETPGQQALEYGKGIGILPFVWYKKQIQERDVISLGLYHDGIVPCCTFTFEDTLGIMSKDGMPLDNDHFELFLNSGSDFIKSIHMRFKVISFQENKNKTYTITGSIDLQDFYKINFKSYTGTSFEVLRNISKELQLGFNSNINSANDSMKWRNPGKRFKEFISEIINHSYISDNSFVLGYIDFYYCFNYVDIEKEWIRDISNDVSISSRGLSQFTDAFMSIRPNNFSYEGLEQLFDYFESYEQDTNEEIELDVIAICCEYSESTINECLDYYDIVDAEDKEDFESLSDYEKLSIIQDWLAKNTSVIGTTDQCTIIYQQF